MLSWSPSCILAKTVPPTEQNRAANFRSSYVQPIVGPPLHECDYIFMSLCVLGNQHFILLIFSVEDWIITILDPFYNDTPFIKLQEMYNEYVEVAVRVIRDFLLI